MFSQCLYHWPNGACYVGYNCDPEAHCNLVLSRLFKKMSNLGRQGNLGHGAAGHMWEVVFTNCELELFFLSFDHELRNVKKRQIDVL